MRFTFPFLCCLLLAGPSLAEDLALPAPPARPRIGLVLSGGGARGTAHVGVLKVLDELHLHVDAIAGTSMGAVVGGLYASGLTGVQIEQLMTSAEWQAAFHDRVSRADLGFRRKQEDREYLVNLPLGIQGRRLLLPTGLVQGQKLAEILRRVTLPVARVTDFDQLPTRFRAVATDLETGAPVIMGSGDLSTAMRASVAAPGFLSPVERDGRLLVDGGLVENLPIDVARAMGVDVLIVVDAGFPLRTRERLTTLTSVSNQALAILVRRDVERQRATLTANDVLLQPALADLASYDFAAARHALQAGEDVARAAQPRLAQLAAVGAAAAARQPVDTGFPVVSFITPDAASARYTRTINEVFADQVGKPLQPAVIAQRLESLYGRGTFENLDYHLVQREPGEYGLAFSARRNTWGPNYLRLGLSLQDDFNGNSQFNAAARAAFTELNSLGAEWVLDLQIGAAPRVATEIYLPLSNRNRYFLAPHLQGEAHDVPQRSTTGALIGQYRVRSFEYGLDLGREFGNSAELRAGLLDSSGTTKVRLGDFSVPDTTYHTHVSFLRFSYDRLDASNFPKNGQAFTVNWRNEQASSGAAGSDLLTLDWRGAWTRGKITSVAWVSGGSTIGGSDTNVRTYFPLGGFLSLSGVAAQSLAGPHYAIARLSFLRNVGNGGEGVLAVPAYVGASLEIGNVWARRSDVSFSSARRDASLFFGADTYIGPTYLAMGYDDTGNTAFYLFLGRSF